MPVHPEKSGAVPVVSELVGVASGASVSVGSGLSGASVSVGSGEVESVTVAEGLRVGLPCTPPVAALAIVPAAMTTANAMRRTLSGFMA